MKTVNQLHTVLILLVVFAVVVVSGQRCAFAADGQVTVTIGANGTATTDNPAGALTAGINSYVDKTTVTYTAVPNTNYEIDTLTCTGTSSTTTSSCSYYIRNNNTDTFNASFRSKKRLTVNVSGNGSVSCGANTVVSTGSATGAFYYGTSTSAVCDMAPAAGFNLTAPATSPQTINMSADNTLNVTFTGAVINKTLAVNITGSGTVACRNGSGGATTTLSSSGNITYASTDTVACAMTPATNFALTSPASNPSTIAMAGSDRTLNVTFSSTIITLVTVSGTVSPVSGGSIRADNATTGAVVVAQGVTAGSAVVGANAAHTFYLIPAAGYGIKTLVYDGSTVTPVCSSGIDATCSYDAPNVGVTPHTISATFDTVYTITATARTVGCGGVNGGAISPATLKVAKGGMATFNVVVNPGYVLKQINYGGSTDMATVQYSAYTYNRANIQGNGAVEAVFTPVFTITATASGLNGAIGTISPSSATVVCGTDSPPFTISTATPAFISDVLVGGVSVGAVTTYTFSSVSANNIISAFFDMSTATDYSITPPFIQAAVLPNLLLMLDNSASMYDLANDPYGKCYDDQYNNAAAADYAGYFVSSSLYSYDSVTNKFVPGATLPASCTFRTADFCVALAGTKPNRTVSNFVAKGKFLNWLSMSKLDLQKKILDGGKYDTGNLTLVAESRGCMGRRFVKLVPNTQASSSADDLSTMTFAIRGPGASDADYVNPITQGGGTRIEIFDAAYNTGSCSAALVDWSTVTSVQLGTLQNDSRACVQCTSTSCDAARTLKAEASIHMIHNCYWYYNNHSFSNTNTLTGDCDNIYSSIYANNPALIVNDLAGDAICSSVINHPLLNGNTTGYLGKCVSIGTGGGGRNAWDPACLDTEMADFCAGMANSDVTDPSGTGVATGSSTSIPSFIIDAGVNALGNVTGTFFANVSLATPPTGLIDEFKEYINFGAMVFNNDGAASECGVSGSNIPCPKHCSISGKACLGDSYCQPAGGTCTVDAVKTDGGKIISYIGYDPVGNHASGLIKNIDDIQAASWTPFAESYYNAIGYFANRPALRLQANDFDATRPPPSESCRLNNILLISDGGSTADQNTSVSALASVYNDGTVNSHGTCPSYAGSKDLSALAWLAKNRNIRNFVPSGGSTATPAKNNESISTYAVYSGPPTASTDPCVPKNLLNSTAVNGGTSLYLANTYEALLQSLRDAFTKIAASTASGTAASIVNKRNESGANILTAIFYPLRDFGGTDNKTKWVGDLQNYWYYFDPFFSYSGLREDTNTDNFFNLQDDYYCSMKFDTTLNRTVASRYRYSLATDTLSLVDTINLDNLNAVWKAGNKLFTRTSASRTIFSNRSFPDYAGELYGASFVNFDPSAASSFRPYLNVSTDAEATKIMNYVRGNDDPAYRSRTVTYNGSTNVWKLGDIISSTPKVQSNIPLNAYHLLYGDSSYSQFLATNNYKNRSMVYVGANDGMLHAFKMGKVTTLGGELTKAKIENSGDALGIGDEEWAYVPRNALPYLKLMADPTYSHMYFVDTSPLLVDASINIHSDCSASNYWECTRQTRLLTGAAAGADNYDAAKSSWRSIVIGGMGYGGASVRAGTSCTTTTLSGQNFNNCVQPPLGLASGLTNYDYIGKSSYFAIDVTNPTSPSLMWEFNASTNMGFTAQDPVVIRASGKTSGILDPSTNGRWFALFVSGPTGPINNLTKQMYGRSDRGLRIYVVDIATGKMVKYFDLRSNDPQILIPANNVLRTANAFGGNLNTNAIDTDEARRSDLGRNSTDVIYIPYVRSKMTIDATPQPTWDNGSEGGLLRLITNDDPDPANWRLSLVIDGTGPITSSINKLYDGKDCGTGQPYLWLYFGSGRYFYRDFTIDAGDEVQTLFGVKDPCYSAATKDMDVACSTSISKSDLEDSTLIKTSYATDKRGWYITMDSTDTVYKTERLLTTPSVRTSGLVEFITFKPSADSCSFGGMSFLRTRNYRTGGLPSCRALSGSYTIQLSTGAIVSTFLNNGTFYCANLSTSNCNVALPPDLPPPSLLPIPPGPPPVPPGVPSVGSPAPPTQLGIGRAPSSEGVQDKPKPPVKRMLHILEK